MTLTVLVDNDIVVKLARMDAFADGLAAIGAQPGTFGSMRAMLRYMGIADENRRLRLTEGNKVEADRLAAALHTIIETELTLEESADAAAAMKVALTNDLDLDEGELMLMVAAVRRGAMDVATGDKRAVRSLPALESDWPAIESLRERIICLEQVFDRLALGHGFARIRAAISTSPRADEAVTFIYGQTPSGNVNRFRDGLELVINAHIRLPAPGWLKPL